MPIHNISFYIKLYHSMVWPLHMQYAVICSNNTLGPNLVTRTHKTDWSQSFCWTCVRDSQKSVASPYRHAIGDDKECMLLWWKTHTKNSTVIVRRVEFGVNRTFKYSETAVTSPKRLAMTFFIFLFFFPRH